MTRVAPETRVFVAGAGPQVCGFCGARYLSEHQCRKGGKIGPVGSPREVTFPLARAVEAPSTELPVDMSKTSVAALLGILNALHRQDRKEELRRLLVPFVVELGNRASRIGAVPAAEILRSVTRLVSDQDAQLVAKPLIQALWPRVVEGADALKPSVLIACCQSLVTLVPRLDPEGLALVKQGLSPMLLRAAACLTGLKPFGLITVFRLIELAGPFEGEGRAIAQRLCRSALPHLSRSAGELDPPVVVNILTTLSHIDIDAGMSARLMTFLGQTLPRSTKGPAHSITAVLAAIGRLPIDTQTARIVAPFAVSVLPHLPSDLNGPALARILGLLGSLPFDEEGRRLANTYARGALPQALSQCKRLKRDDLLALQKGLLALGINDEGPLRVLTVTLEALPAES